MCGAHAGGGGDPLVAGNGGRQEEVVGGGLPGGRDTWERGEAKIASTRSGGPSTVQRELV